MEDRLRFPFRYRAMASPAVCAILLLCACGGTVSAPTQPEPVATREVSAVAVDPASIRMPAASGVTVYAGDGMTLDASNTGDGYVMVAAEPNEKEVVTRVTAEQGVYHYRQPTDNSYETYPLQMGSGAYSVQGYEQVEGSRYARTFAEDLTVTLTDESAPFLIPNQFVPYTASDDIVSASYTITQGMTDPQQIADTLYRYVSKNTAYDYDKAATVEEGYLPVPDVTLESRTGICFDYAALLAAMLRVQGIPAKLVIGHVAPDNIYHAWNEVLIGGKWVFYDPTLASENRPETNYQPERIY